jgi:SAM-dependent methyltransferase
MCHVSKLLSRLRRKILGERDARVDVCLRHVKKDVDRERSALVAETLQRIVACGAADYVEPSLTQHVAVPAGDVVEIGSHYCWYAPFFLAAGARSYTGTDLEYDPDYRMVRGPRGTVEVPLGFAEFCGCFDGIRVCVGDVRDLDLADSFDLAFLISTSEHFDDVPGCFQAIGRMLRPGGRLFVDHHNYYSWTGHHRGPWTVAEFDAANESHRQVVDWQHVIQPVQNLGSQNYLNFIRPHELIDIVASIFALDEKRLVPSSAARGGGRLSADIQRRMPRYLREELEAESVFLWAHKPAQAASPASLIKRPVKEHQVSLTLGWAEREAGHCYISRLPSIGKLTSLTLLENDKPLGPNAALHDAIRGIGKGRYAVHGGNYLYFSTSDNSDPNSNGRKYELRSQAG